MSKEPYPTLPPTYQGRLRDDELDDGISGNWKHQKENWLSSKTVLLLVSN